ncbi:hypothetical protein GQX73_g4981 [Xylaria multiplex]|uniref:TM7S3/TM198-like domain-containing protein n=1 Tax=Xylaria multiplex TaxID=323545 RepID=A0A7C8IQC8_9PEZI|nr:hypothetical protein GQX73_g4981 [Xylaria multiplex]
MTTRWNYAWALLFLFLHLYGVVAGPLEVLRRQDATATATIGPKTTTSRGEGDIETSSEKTDGTKATQTTTADMSTTIMVTSTTAFPSAINGNSPDNNNSSLATPNPIPDGQLPLAPRLTPGWGVAGALLLISGAVYTLIGIKNAWLYTYLSAAFLSGLSVTVLIVYVMAPPVPAAIEGAYVVAAVVTGLILGGAAIVFREIAEGLGCLLGGFCVSMWLLTLKPGGLLPSTVPKVIFIAAFSVGGYGFYFSRYTRPYAQMGLMSFAGATVTVIGIDCFSRAGLKEFWAYIWNLNKGLFPYAADTYPLTKGIRVEIALTVVFTIIGIISQVKLWRVIQERRAKKVEEQAEEQRKRNEEEANLGLQIEAQNARERRQWETVYGDQPPRSLTGSEDSGVEDMEDEKTKKIRISHTVVRQVSSNEDVIEMVELPSPDITSLPDTTKSVDGKIMTNQNDDSRMTTRVAEDDGPSGHNDITSTSEQNEKVWVVKGSGEARPSSIISSHIPQISPKLAGPEVTPLPFKIPNESDENESRSSIATYADEDDGDYVLSQKPSRLSLTNRLSVGSGNLIQSLSRRSGHSWVPKRKTGESEAQQSPGFVRSTDELVENYKRHSDASSIAATIDDLSQDGDAHDYSTKDRAERVSTPELTVDFGGNATKPDNADNKGDTVTKLKPLNTRLRLSTRPTSSAETVGTDILDPSIVNSSSGDLSKRSSLNQSTKKTESTTGNSNPTDITAIEETSEGSMPSKSPDTSINSTSMSLTKDRLPSALTRVALSYRTNEWAKHLSAAEAPQLEQLQLDGYPDRQDNEKLRAEAAAPVHVEELQQTAESIIPLAVTIRSSSSASNLPQIPSPVDHSSSRISSHSSPKVHIPATLAILTSASSEVAEAAPVKPTLSNVPQAGHSFRNKRQRNSSEVYNQPIQEEDGNEPLPNGQQASSDEGGNFTPNSTPPSPTGPAPIPGVVSYSSPQTLLGKREMFLRNKSQSQLFNTGTLPIQENPEYTTRPASQLASPYNYTSLMTQDIDDIPLSQRKELMRQNSMLSVNSANSMSGRPKRNSSSNTPYPLASNSSPHAQVLTAESSNFDSHQPKRYAQVPSQAARDARLSQFRQSVAAELRAPAQKSGRETPLLVPTSSTSLAGPSANNAEVSRAIDQQRSALMSQREQEAQRREAERWEKARNDRAFEEMMRNGGLIDAHREALRRMQGGVKHE